MDLPPHIEKRRRAETTSGNAGKENLYIRCLAVTAAIPQVGDAQ
jgi:hypothetical protein